MPIFHRMWFLFLNVCAVLCLVVGTSSIVCLWKFITVHTWKAGQHRWRHRPTTRPSGAKTSPFLLFTHTHTKRTDNVFMTAQRCRPPVFFYPMFGAACFFIAAYRTLRITGEMSNQIADRRRQWPNKNSKNTWNEEKILVCIVFNAVIGHFWGGESSF